MNILYVGQLGGGTTTLDRMRALQRLGHNIISVNATEFLPSFRLLRSIQVRRNPKWLLQEFNQNILVAASKMASLDVVWIDKGLGVFPETLDQLKQKNSCLLVHYTPDSQFIVNRSKHFLASVPIYDHLITTKAFEIDFYLKAGCKNVVFATQSYCPIRYSSARANKWFFKDIGLISDYKPPYGKIIRHLSKQGFDVGVWGPKWKRASYIGKAPRSCVMGGGVWGSDYVNALASFKIGLGLLSKYIPEQHTTRSFEIPAAGSFLLAERTDEHLEYFSEGEEAEFFDSMDELENKSKFYLSNAAVRKKNRR